MRYVHPLAGVASILLLLARPTFAQEPLAIIVHPSRAAHVERAEVARIFLKQQRFWSDGEPIVAINREPGCASRASFSERVLGGSSGWLSAYWNEQYFHGIFPPATLSSAAAVKKFVASERNAIGYINASEVDDSVGVVLRVP